MGTQGFGATDDANPEHPRVALDIEAEVGRAAFAEEDVPDASLDQRPRGTTTQWRVDGRRCLSVRDHSSP